MVSERERAQEMQLEHYACLRKEVYSIYVCFVDYEKAFR